MATRYLKNRAVHHFAFVVREGDASEVNAQALTEGVITADFETDKYKTEKKKDKFIDAAALAGYGDAEKQQARRELRAAHYCRSAEFRAGSGE